MPPSLPPSAVGWRYQPEPAFPPYPPPPASRVKLDPVLQVALAPWWKRVVALLVDVIVLGVGTFFLGIVISVAVGSHARTTTGTTTAGSGVAPVIALWAVSVVPTALYYGIMNGSRRGQTVGKLALSIAVRDARSGGRIGFWRGIARFLIEIVFMVFLYVPYIIDSLAPLWHRRRQSWHDRVVRSVVIDLKP